MQLVMWKVENVLRSTKVISRNSFEGAPGFFFFFPDWL